MIISPTPIIYGLIFYAVLLLVEGIYLTVFGKSISLNNRVSRRLSLLEQANNNREKVASYSAGIVDGLEQSVELTLNTLSNAAKTFSYSADVQEMAVGLEPVSPTQIGNMLMMVQSYTPDMKDVLLTDRTGATFQDYLYKGDPKLLNAATRRDLGRIDAWLEAHGVGVQPRG